MLPPNLSEVELDHLEEAQLTSSKPQGNELSLADGNETLTSRVLV